VTTLNADDRARQVSSLVSGRVEEFYVQDGDFVKKGDPIVRVVDVDPDLLDRLAGEKAQVEAQIAAVEQARSTAAIDVRAPCNSIARAGRPPRLRTDADQGRRCGGQACRIACQAPADQGQARAEFRPARPRAA
jgi:multidrug efflux pump subunit AcrA (membrane-fusion protein)